MTLLSVIENCTWPLFGKGAGIIYWLKLSSLQELITNWFLLKFCHCNSTRRYMGALSMKKLWMEILGHLVHSTSKP